MKRLLLISVFVCAINFSQAQNLTQVIRGTVIDKNVKNELIGATVILPSTSPMLGTVTDVNGNFRIENVPAGTYTVRVSYIGYKPLDIPNVQVNTGKETILTIELEENIIQGNEIIVTADKRKDQPLNELSTVSARTFSVEETQRYAAAVNDPGRMVTSFAGVVSTDDGNNKISIRGNSPNGLLWRMEGIDIPNPNHFSGVGTSGGGISILSAQLLSNSDFISGAFAAEYGNALSGVFDLKLRKGNNEKNEFTAQASVLGLSFAAEGPFKKNYGGSYLVNYRYSTLGILSKLGVLDIGGVTTFQDLSFNVFLPTKKAGYFSVFGIGGLSAQNFKAIADTAKWEHFYDRLGSTFFSNTGVTGFTHSYIFNSKAYLRTSVSISGEGKGYNENYTDDELNLIKTDVESFQIIKQSAASVLNYKFNSKLLLRTGFTQTRSGFKLKSERSLVPGDVLITQVEGSGETYDSQIFAQLKYSISNKFSVNAGLHAMYLWLNNTNSIEPRASLKYDLGDKQSISIGYGLHSQQQPIGLYFAQNISKDEKTFYPNRNLKFTNAHHLVLSYNYLLGQNLRIKTEFYYQWLFDVPVSVDSATSFSMLNQAEGFISEKLINNGTGTNRGMEFTLEKFLSNRFYYLLSISLYESKYKGSDGIERNTRYNGNIAGSFTAGKEFMLSKKPEATILGFNTKILYSGGYRFTPIDLEASIASGGTVEIENNAFSKQNPDYFRIDAAISLKRNKPYHTTILSLDIQNATNRKNVFGQYFEPQKQSIVTYYQTTIIPVLSYKVEF